jgi:hypothetical protein
MHNPFVKGPEKRRHRRGPLATLFPGERAGEKQGVCLPNGRRYSIVIFEAEVRNHFLAANMPQRVLELHKLDE